MNIGERNITAGAVVLILAACFGFYLGLSIDAHLSNRIYMMSIDRVLLRGGHTHGMLTGLLNIVLGLVLLKGYGNKKIRNITSWLGLGAFLLPVGLILRGLTAASMTFAPLAMTGALCLIASMVMLLVSRR
jgi:hypothetical protein